MDHRAIDRIVEMAWEDRTPFDAITLQFGLTEAEVIKLNASRNEAVFIPYVASSRPG